MSNDTKFDFLETTLQDIRYCRENINLINYFLKLVEKAKHFTDYINTYDHAQSISNV